MKKAIFIFFFVSLFCTKSFSQISDENTELINTYFSAEQLSANDIQARGLVPESEGISQIDVYQNGLNNSVFVNSLQTGDSQVVTQNGNQNNYEYYNYYSQENSSMQINQDGTSNSVQVFGENSLMKDAVINQKSDFNTIVVRNYTN